MFRLYKCAPNKLGVLMSIMPISSPNPMFEHLLESSRWDDSSKWSNIVSGEEITQVELIEVQFTHLIWSSDTMLLLLCVYSQTCVEQSLIEEA